MLVVSIQISLSLAMNESTDHLATVKDFVATFILFFLSETTQRTRPLIKRGSCTILCLSTSTLRRYRLKRNGWLHTFDSVSVEKGEGVGKREWLKEIKIDLQWHLRVNFLACVWSLRLKSTSWVPLRLSP